MEAVRYSCSGVLCTTAVRSGSGTYSCSTAVSSMTTDRGRTKREAYINLVPLDVLAVRILLKPEAEEPDVPHPLIDRPLLHVRTTEAPDGELLHRRCVQWCIVSRHRSLSLSLMAFSAI